MDSIRKGYDQASVIVPGLSTIRLMLHRWGSQGEGFKGFTNNSQGRGRIILKSGLS